MNPWFVSSFYLTSDDSKVPTKSVRSTLVYCMSFKLCLFSMDGEAIELFQVSMNDDADDDLDYH